MEQITPAELSKLSVLIERQLWQKMGLVDRLDSINRQLTKMLRQPGSASMSDEDVRALKGLWAQAAEMMEEIRSREQRVRQEIVNTLGEPLSIGAFMHQIEPVRRASLDSVRTKLRERLQKALGALVGNQATLVYLFDFHRNFIGSLCQHDFSDNQYSETGRSRLIQSGTLLHRAV